MNTAQNGHSTQALLARDAARTERFHSARALLARDAARTEQFRSARALLARDAGMLSEPNDQLAGRQDRNG